MRTGLFLASEPEGDGPMPGQAVTWSGMRVYDITADARRDALVPLVREYTTLEAIADPVKRQTALLEWIVRCAENPQTRREGFYDFSSVNDMRQWRMNSEDAYRIATTRLPRSRSPTARSIGSCPCGSIRSRNVKTARCGSATRSASIGASSSQRSSSTPSPRTGRAGRRKSARGCRPLRRSTSGVPDTF